MHAIYLTALLGAVVAAAPSLAPRTTSAQTDKFDDLTATPGVAVNQAGNQGLYNKKVYRGFALSDARIPGNPDLLISSIISRPGVSPYSPTNQIAWGTTDLQTLLAGQVSLIDTNYPGSTVKYINLIRLRVGCSTATKASVTAVPAECDVNLTCNRADGTKVSQIIKFRLSAPTQTRVTGMLAEIAGFTKCTSVKFDNPVSLRLLAAGVLLVGLADNIEYNLTV